MKIEFHWNSNHTSFTRSSENQENKITLFIFISCCSLTQSLRWNEIKINIRRYLQQAVICTHLQQRQSYRNTDILISFPNKDLNRSPRTSFKHLSSLSIYGMGSIFEIYSAKRVGLHILFEIKFLFFSSCIEQTYSTVSYTLTKLIWSSICRANNNNGLTRATYIL